VNEKDKRNWPAPDPDTAAPWCGHANAELIPCSYVMEIHGRVEWVFECAACDDECYRDV